METIMVKILHIICYLIGGSFISEFVHVLGNNQTAWDRTKHEIKKRWAPHQVHDSLPGWRKAQPDYSHSQLLRHPRPRAVMVSGLWSERLKSPGYD